MTASLIRNETAGRFEWTGGFETREAPKKAGFRWDPQVKRWWTTDLRVAARLITHADDAARPILQAVAEQQAETLEASRAKDAEIDVPAPDGLAYMPFQRAGILFCLRAFGDV